MQFNDHHIAVLDSFTKQELLYLLEFLKEERKRHAECIEDAISKSIIRPLMAPIYNSAILRHQEDLVSLDAKVEEIKEKFNVH